MENIPGAQIPSARHAPGLQGYEKYSPVIGLHKSKIQPKIQKASRHDTPKKGIPL
jgi:hypothetical protein